MKRYLLFAGAQPNGGWADLAGDHDSIEEARAQYPSRRVDYAAVPGQWLDVTQPLPPAIAERVADVRMIIPMLQLVDGDQVTLWQAHQRGVQVASGEFLESVGLDDAQKAHLQAEIDRYADAPSSDHVWVFDQADYTEHEAGPGLDWQQVVDGHDGKLVAVWTPETGWVQDKATTSGLIIAGAGSIPPR